MKRSNQWLEPMRLWTQWGMQYAQMALASSQVIQHRVQRMAAAGPIPNAVDRKEFSLMKSEKVDAAIASSSAMSEQMMKAGEAMALMMWKQTAAQMGNLFSLSMPTPMCVSPVTQLNARRLRAARTAVRQLNQTNLQIARSAAQIASQGLKPVHVRATANAKRLAKHKQR